jgi:phosphotransacetylase
MPEYGIIDDRLFVVNKDDPFINRMMIFEEFKIRNKQCNVLSMYIFGQDLQMMQSHILTKYVMIVDGEMQAHLPFNLDLMKENHPFSDLAEQGANVLIFPNLSSSNIAYNLVKEIADIEKIGPILLGLKKPVHVVQLGSTTREIVNMIAIAVVDAQMNK